MRLFKSIVVAFVLSVSANTATAVPVQWAVADGGNGHWYEAVFSLFSATGAFADAASRTHMGMQGYAATITSAGEQRFLNSLNPNNALLWLGGSDRDVEGTWDWVTGPESGTQISASYANWAAGEPNDFATGEDYMVGWWTSDQWNDLPGTIENGYIVEFSGISVVPLPATAGMLGTALLVLGFWGWRRQRAG